MDETKRYDAIIEAAKMLHEEATGGSLDKDRFEKLIAGFGAVEKSAVQMAKSLMSGKRFAADVETTEMVSLMRGVAARLGAVEAETTHSEGSMRMVFAPKSALLGETFLAHVLMDQTKEYLERGRRFNPTEITNDKLKEMWIAAIRRFAVGDRENHIEYEDVCAELSLRGIDPPEEAVKAETEAMAAEVRRLGRGPMSDRFNDQVAAFNKERQNPN
jgi:hypothetical protein